MSTSHEHSERTNIEREDSPTETKLLQDAYRREFSTRFRKFRGVLRETVAENDALGLRRRTQQEMEPAEEFDFPQDPAKQVAFYNLIQQWIEEGILEPIPTDRVRGGQHYTAAYVQAAYRKGIDFADDEIVRAGGAVPDEELDDVVGRPIHLDTLEILYTRNYSGDAETPGLRGITDDLDETISRKFVEAMREGWGPHKTASELNKEARTIQKTRARAMARSEILHAHNSSALNRYREFGVTEVDIINHSPCAEICAPIVADAPYPITDIPLGGPPFHPNCVGSVAPVI